MKIFCATILLDLFTSGFAHAGNYSWTNLGPEGQDIRALAIDPTSHQTLYAGSLGGGVFKSTDGGGSWNAITTGLTDTLVHCLAINPTAPPTLYAGTDGGVFKSTNGGSNWIATGLSLNHISALAIDPKVPQTIYAGTEGQGIYKSTDGGSSWIDVGAGLDTTVILSLAIDPTAPQTIYAGTERWYGALFKSTDGGSSWTLVTAGMYSSTDVYALAIDPAAPQTIYAGAYCYNVYPFNIKSGVYKSMSGGNSWSFAGLLTVYPDQVNALAINPTAPQTVYAGTKFGGVFMSTDGGGYWGAIGLGGVNALAIDTTTPQTLYAGTSLGVWGYSMPPILEITMSKSIYGNGDTVAATEFRLENLGSAIAAELKVWLAGPGINPIGLFNLGSYGSFVMPASFDYDFGPLPLFTVTSSLPRGTYEFSSRIVDPITGKLLSESLNPFVIQ